MSTLPDKLEPTGPRPFSTAASSAGFVAEISGVDLAEPLDEAVLDAMIDELETTMDRAAAANPNPGTRTFQRLNRAEYKAAVKDLLGLDVEVSAFLPLDTKSAGFDNIAAIQQAIRDGRVLATADQHGDQLAVYGIEAALAVLESPDAQPEDRETPVDLVTAGTLAE